MPGLAHLKNKEILLCDIANDNKSIFNYYVMFV